KPSASSRKKNSASTANTAPSASSSKPGTGWRRRGHFALWNFLSLEFALVQRPFPIIFAVMLTSLQIQNFKAWQDTGPVRMAPLTVIFGANSAGKSSLGHLMLALKQTVQSTDRRRALHLGDEKSLIDLGTFQDCLHGHNTEIPLQFRLKWKLPSALGLQD